MTEADLPFEVLQDPYGIAFWPEFKGRDGCRTPMPWDGKLTHAGFTRGQPWLPVPPEHAACAVAGLEREPYSVLNFARNLIQWRKTVLPLTLGDISFFNAPEPILALQRELDGKNVFAAFNLSDRPQSFEWPLAAAAQALTGHGLPGAKTGARLELPAYGGWFGA